MIRVSDGGPRGTVPSLFSGRRSFLAKALLTIFIFSVSLHFSYWRRITLNTHPNFETGENVAPTESWTQIASDPVLPSSMKYETEDIFATERRKPILTPQITNTSYRNLEVSLNNIWKPYASLLESEKKLFASHTKAHCVTRGMQSKCLFKGFMVHQNRFHVFGKSYLVDQVPNPIFPPDGQNGPLKQYHRYRGHPIISLEESPPAKDFSDVKFGNTSNPHCDVFVTRPTVFLYRMSGHSTYHMWENNLGPFYQTLHDAFGLNGPEGDTLRQRLQDPKELLIAFVDDKPAKGPKAPKLLDKYLSLFSDVPLINASALNSRVCFSEAIVGTSSNHFHHSALLRRIMEGIAGYSPPPPLPPFPSVLFISRNHPSVIRGRKISNEVDVLRAVNETLFSAYEARFKKLSPSELIAQPPFTFRKIHMEDYSFEEQIRIAMRTNLILSPHGGGVTNCIWMREGSVIVEFVAPVGKSLTNMYHTLCGKSGVTHFHFLADPDPADEGLDMKGNARLFSNMVIPPSRMTQNVLKALSLYDQNYRKYVK